MDLGAGDTTHPIQQSFHELTCFLFPTWSVTLIFCVHILLWLLPSNSPMQWIDLNNLINPDQPGYPSLFLRRHVIAWDLLWQLLKVFDGASNLLLWAHLWWLWPRCESHFALRRIPKNDISWLKTPGKCSHVGDGKPSSFRSTTSLRRTMGWGRIWEKPYVLGSLGRSPQPFIYSDILSTCSQWVSTRYEPGMVKFKI